VIGGHDDYESYEDWVAVVPSVDPGAESTNDDVAFQLYSSGTTGRPKGVMLTNDNFFSLLPLAKEMWELSPDAVNLIAMPLFHIGGGGWAVAGHVRRLHVGDLPRPRPGGADPHDRAAAHHPCVHRAGGAGSSC
jgi:acyl-coenzyme A synthetase/AMP-(fatty) acid ligase